MEALIADIDADMKLLKKELESIKNRLPEVAMNHTRRASVSFCPKTPTTFSFSPTISS